MAKVKAGFKAGDMVVITRDAQETRWSRAAHQEVGEGYAWANYHMTAEDTEKWYTAQRNAIKEAQAAGEDTFSIAMDCAGESRLPPRGGQAKLFVGTPYRVLRARCRESFSYYNATGGWTKLLDLNTGREVYINMKKLKKVTIGA